MTLPVNKTKIICTIGPASESADVIEQMHQGLDRRSPDEVYSNTLARKHVTVLTTRLPLKNLFRLSKETEPPLYSVREHYNGSLRKGLGGQR